MLLSKIRLRWLNTFALFSFLLFSGCSKKMLEIHTDYINIESLASYYINTPDPLLDRPPIGQRLLISWNIPKELLEEENPHLYVVMHLRNREERAFTIPLKKSCGSTIYSLLNQEYCTTRGILTYKVQLFAGGCLKEEWRHQLWAELILFPQQ